MNNNNFVDRNLVTIVMFCVVFVVLIFFAEKFLVYDKLGAYSNLIVAFTSVCAILIALRQGEINLRISRKDNKVHAHSALKIALFANRVSFISELRNRFEKIEEIIYKVWQIPPEFVFQKLDNNLLEQLKTLEYQTDEALFKELSLKINALNLFVKQNKELLSFDSQDIKLKEIHDFIFNFKSVIYFLCNTKRIVLTLESVQKKDLIACKKYLQSRIQDKENFNYCEETIKFKISIDENNSTPNFEKLSKIMHQEIENYIILMNKFHNKAPWKEFKHSYEKIISTVIESSKI